MHLLLVRFVRALLQCSVLAASLNFRQIIINSLMHGKLLYVFLLNWTFLDYDSIFDSIHLWLYID